MAKIDAKTVGLIIGSLVAGGASGAGVASATAPAGERIAALEAKVTETDKRLTRIEACLDKLDSRTILILEKLQK